MGDHIVTTIVAAHSESVLPANTPRPARVRVTVGEDPDLFVVTLDDPLYTPYSNAVYLAAEAIYQGFVDTKHTAYLAEMEALLDDLESVLLVGNNAQFVFQAAQAHQPFTPPVSIASEVIAGVEWFVVAGADTDALNAVRDSLPDDIP